LKAQPPWWTASPLIADLLFAKELQRRFAGTKKTAYAVHPGVVDTNLARNLGPVLSRVLAAIGPLFLKSVGEGAATEVFAAVSPKAVPLAHDIPNPIQPAQHQPVELNGKTVLINGAAGGVGHFALQLAKWKGARVIAVADGTHEAFLREFGADEFIDYTKSKPEDTVSNVDLVVDSIGGPTSARFLRTLKRGGALFPIFGLGFNGAEEAEKLGITVSTTQVRSSGAQLAELAPLLDQGTVRVWIDSKYDLADAQKAHERAARGHIRGKIVLEVK